PYHPRKSLTAPRRARGAGCGRPTALQFTPPARHGTRATYQRCPVAAPLAARHPPVGGRADYALRWPDGRARFRPGRSFVTEARQSGAPDVRALTEVLLSRAAGSGGQLRSAEVAQAVESAGVSPSQAKKLLRTLAEAGVTAVVDASTAARRKVAAARSATPASRATTAKATRKPAEAAPEPVPAEPVIKVVKSETAAPKQNPPKQGSSPEDVNPPAKAARATKAGKAAKAAGKAPAADDPAATATAGPATAKEGDEPDDADIDPEALAAELEDVVVDEPAEVVAVAEADAEADSDDFEWDDEESEALKQARRDAELTASADSVRAYLKQIGK